MLLSNRQKQTLELLLQAKADKEIAEEMGIAPRTVKAHLQSMYKKFGIDQANGGQFPRIRLVVLAHAIRESLGVNCIHCAKADSVPAGFAGAC